MANDDYEILPHQAIEDLKAEVSELKKRLQQPDAYISQILAQMSALKGSLDNFSKIMDEALKSIGSEEELSLTTFMKELDHRFDKVEDQNTKIAQSIISIANLIEKSGRDKGRSGSTAPPEKGAEDISPANQQGVPSMPLPPQFTNKPIPPPMPPPPKPKSSDKKSFISKIFK